MTREEILELVAMQRAFYGREWPLILDGAISIINAFSVAEMDFTHPDALWNATRLAQSMTRLELELLR